MSEMVDRVARAVYEAQPRNRPWEKLPLPQREYCAALALAAIKALRELPVEIQMAGCEGQIAEVVRLDGPVKLQDECTTPDDWMSRGFGLGKRMMSGGEFMAGWNAAIDAALSEPSS